MKCQPNRNLEDLRGRPTQVHRVPTAGRILLSIWFALCGCSPEPGILVNIAAWPDGVERIRVRTTVEDKRGMDFFLDKDQARFAVRVPVDSEGTVQLDAVGLDARGCMLATGMLSETVPNGINRFVERTLVLSSLSAPVCVFAPSLPVNVGLKPNTLAVGEFNGDGFSDIAVANSGSAKDSCSGTGINTGRDTVSVLLGDALRGAVPAMPISLTPNSVPDSVAVGDFNGDTKPDVAIALYESKVISVLFGNGMGGFTDTGPMLAVALGSNALAVGDFNRDMNLDLVALSSSTLTVFLGDGRGGFDTRAPIAAGGGGSLGLAVGDLDGDTRPDLAVTHSSDDTVSVLLGDGSGGFSMPTSFDVGEDSLLPDAYPKSVTIADFNGDLKPDLAVANFGRSDGDVGVLFGNGKGGFGAPSNFVFGRNPYSLAVGDFNKDGLPDIATADYSDNTVSVRLNNSLGGFSPAQHFSVGLTPIYLAGGDFNGDLLPDLAVVNFYACSVSILLNQFD